MRRPPPMPPPPVPTRSQSEPSSPNWLAAASLALFLGLLVLLALLLSFPPGGTGRGDAGEADGAAGDDPQGSAAPSTNGGQGAGDGGAGESSTGQLTGDGAGDAPTSSASAGDASVPISESEAGAAGAEHAGAGASEAVAATAAAPQVDATSAGAGAAAHEADAASAGGATSADPAEVPPRRTSGVLYTLPPVAADSAGSAPAGDGNSADFFGVGATGKRFVYVVDKSSSMTGEKFQAAREELFRSINALQASQSFYIIFYDDQVHAMPGGFARGRRKEKQAAQQWCLQAFEKGGTIPTPAVVHGLSERPDAVFLLSDGEFDMLDVERITAANSAANSADRIPIHTIGFQANAATLREIAERNRGKYRYVR